MAILSSSDNLRRHVLDGAAEGVGALVGLVSPEGPAQPEVGEDDVTVLIEEDVLQLDVAIYHTALDDKNNVRLGWDGFDA